jgi:hypothetical protein
VADIVEQKCTGVAWIDGHRTPCRIELEWHREDPLVARFSFAAPGQEGDDVARWELSRAGILRALAGTRAGIGDAVMWTAAGALMLRLAPGGPVTVVQVPGLPVASFLSRTQQEVESGSQEEQMIVDHAMEAFLANLESEEQS